MTKALLKTFLYFPLLSAAVWLPSCQSKKSSTSFSGSNKGLQQTQSGVWRGFWIQNGTKGDMNLDLRIANNRITGQGSDLVGSFTLDGPYDEQGNVKINKQYFQAHLVIYTGLYKDNRIDGQWFIPSTNDKGVFQLNWNTTP